MKKPVPTSPLDTDVPMKHRAAWTSDKIRFHIPYVATHIARIVTKNLMDYEAAAKEILETGEVNYAVGKLAEKLEKEPHVQEAVQRELSAAGLDDGSQKEFFKEVWFQFFHGTKDLKKVAMQLLGKGFITEKGVDDKPQPLVIKGMEAGVKKMGLFDEKDPGGNTDAPGSDSVN